MRIIGITGTFGSGKGTVTDILIKKGWRHYSATAFITSEIEKRNMTVNRDSLIEVGNDLRKKYGSDYVIRSLFHKAVHSKKNSVIESIRTVGEVDLLRTYDNFYLISVDADIKKRYERIRQRGSAKDDVTFAEFQNREEREMKNDDSTKQNLSACAQLADYHINNDGTIERLREEVDKVMENILGQRNA